MDLSLNLAQAASDLGLFATLVSVATVEFLPRLAAALVVAAIGYVAAVWAGRLIQRLLGRAPRFEPTLVPVVAVVARYALMIFVIVAALAELGVQTTSLLTVLGAAGLAIGLALQGTLQNIAAGIMLLFLRPFRVNETIETPAVGGKVEEVGLFATRLRTADGVYKFVPNSELWNRILTNYDRNPTRLLTLPFAVAYDGDIAAAREALRKLAEAHPRVLKDVPVEVVATGLGETAVTIELRAWFLIGDYWGARWDLIEGGKTALEHAGLALPAPRLVRLAGEAVAPAR